MIWIEQSNWIKEMDIPHEAEARAWDILPGFGRLHHPSSDATLFSSSLPVLPHGKLQLSDSRDGFSLIDDAAVSRPNKFQESVDDIDSHSIGNLLPDEDDLLTGMMDDLDLSELPDADDYDLFGSGGGMELDADFRDNLSMTGPPRFSLSSLGGGNAIPQFNIQNGAGTVAGEHPYGEHPSRTLFVRNINSNVEDSELKALFEQYGDIRTLYTTCKHRGFVMISYYDIRSARMAMRALQNKPAAEVSYIHQPIAWKRQQQMPPQRTFVVQEMHEAKMVNVVEGLKLYDKMIDAKEVSQLVSLANNLRITGRRGQLQSEAYVAYKRPNRGHGREMIQLGLPIADIPPGTENIKDRRIEPIPSVLLDIIERLVSKQIIPVKPDACIIDFFNEGDYSQPHMYLPWFGRPVGVLSLSECDVTFGRVIVSYQRGDYKGSLKLSLTPGSVLLVEGESADLAKHAIHSTRNQRIFITFTKSHQPPPQPRKPIPGTGVFLPPDSTQTTLLI